MILHNLIYMFFGVNEIPPKRLGLTGAIELYPVITEIFVSDFTSTTTTGHRNRAHFGGTRPQKSKGYVLADVWCGVALAFPLQTRSIRMMNCARRTPTSSVSIKIQR